VPAKVTIRKSFLTSRSQEAAFSSLQNVLSSLELKNLKTKKSVEFSYLLMEYKEGFMQKGEIEFYFLTRQTKTEFSIKWSYPSDEEDQPSEDGEEFGDGAEIIIDIFSRLKGIGKTSLNYEKIIEELRLKMNATEIVVSQISNENQSQKVEILKIKCRACLEVYDIALSKCPRCGLGVN
jgi:hypothetical protein